MNGMTKPNCWQDKRFTNHRIKTSSLRKLAHDYCTDCPVFTDCRAGIRDDRQHFVIRAGIIGREYRATIPLYEPQNIRDTDVPHPSRIR